MTKLLPEIFCDLNAGVGVNSYRLTVGSFADLERLGLTPEQAVGMRFSFNGGADEDENGQPADIMFEGTVAKDDRKYTKGHTLLRKYTKGHTLLRKASSRSLAGFFLYLTGNFWN